MDAQLPPALAVFLRAQGLEATHVAETGMARFDDAAVWDHACRSGATIVTKDDDFKDRVLLSKTKIPVVLIRVGNCSNRALLAWFAPVLPGLTVDLASFASICRATSSVTARLL